MAARFMKCPPGSPKPKSLANVKAVKVGVKAGGSTERFWVRVTGKNGKSLTGRIDNHLVLTKLHGRKFGDRVTVQPSQVFATIRGNPMKGVPGGSVTACIKRMTKRKKKTGRPRDPAALCAWIADRREPGWRSRPRKKKPKLNPARLRSLTRI